MTRAMYGQVFAGSGLLSGGEGEYTVLLTSSYSRDWVANRLEVVVRRALEGATGKQGLKVDFAVFGEPPEQTGRLAGDIAPDGDVKVQGLREAAAGREARRTQSKTIKISANSASQR